jgi:16S rRNA (guanine527-N7)-methyltransferase
LSRSLAAAGPPTDEDLAQIVTGGASRLGIALGNEPANQLVSYLRLIERWNATYNLTAVRSLEAMATQHIVDSMSVMPALRTRLAGGENRILDVGAGAGLPGVVVAILERDAAVVCVDSVGKKAAFVRQVAATLGLQNLSAVHSRVEAMTAPPAFGVIVSRAFSSLLDFVSSTRHLLAAGGSWIAMKGKVPLQELSDAERSGATFEVEQVIVPGLYAERCLIVGRLTQDSER